MDRDHLYSVSLEWTGNTSMGTSSYTGYERSHLLTSGGKPPIAGSSDPAFRGDRDRWNPEELLVASLSACHQLQYLHLCAVNGIRVLAYADEATGRMAQAADGSGRFTAVTLRPRVTIAPGGDAALALALHGEAGRLCFIAASVGFPVDHAPSIAVAG